MTAKDRENIVKEMLKDFNFEYSEWECWIFIDRFVATLKSLGYKEIV